MTDDPLVLDSRDTEVPTRDLPNDTSAGEGASGVTTAILLSATLRTGLFSPRGTERYTWSHHSYVEFLAAWYAVEHRIELSQAKDLVIHPDHVIPQLRETAAWMAPCMAPFATVVGAEPEVLLSGTRLK